MKVKRTLLPYFFEQSFSNWAIGTYWPMLFDLGFRAHAANFAEVGCENCKEAASMAQEKFNIRVNRTKDSPEVRAANRALAVTK